MAEKHTITHKLLAKCNIQIDQTKKDKVSHHVLWWALTLIWSKLPTPWWKSSNELASFIIAWSFDATSYRKEDQHGSNRPHINMQKSTKWLVCSQGIGVISYKYTSKVLASIWHPKMPLTLSAWNKSFDIEDGDPSFSTTTGQVA